MDKIAAYIQQLEDDIDTLDQGKIIKVRGVGCNIKDVDSDTYENIVEHTLDRLIECGLVNLQTKEYHLYYKYSFEIGRYERCSERTWSKLCASAKYWWGGIWE